MAEDKSDLAGGENRAGGQEIAGREQDRNDLCLNGNPCCRRAVARTTKGAGDHPGKWRVGKPGPERPQQMEQEMVRDLQKEKTRRGLDTGR